VSAEILALSVTGLRKHHISLNICLLYRKSVIYALAEYKSVAHIIQTLLHGGTASVMAYCIAYTPSPSPQTRLTPLWYLLIWTATRRWRITFYLPTGLLAHL